MLLVACGPAASGGGGGSGGGDVGGGGGWQEPPPPAVGGPGADGARPQGENLFDRIPQGRPGLGDRVVGLLASQVGPWGTNIGWNPRLYGDREYAGDARYLFSSGYAAPWVMYFETAVPLGMNHLKNWKVPLPGGKEATYDADLLFPGARNPFGLSRPAHLIDVEVNGGRGAAANLHFVATRVRVLDGTADYPIDATAALGEARRRWNEFVAAQATAIAAALEAASTAPTGPMTAGPTERAFEGVSPTWLPESRRLRVSYVRWVLRWSTQVTRPPPPSCPPGAPCALDPDIINHYGYGIELGLDLEFDAAGRLVVDEPHPPAPLHPASVQASGLLGRGDR